MRALSSLFAYVVFLGVFLGTTHQAHAQALRTNESGLASWYSPTFHGQLTTSSEAYNHEALTAAHPSLPFNTMVRVERHDGTRAVEVRINDRMHPSPMHIIDLSGAAAKALGMSEGQDARVNLVPITDIRPVTSLPFDYNRAISGDFTLQIGAFNTLESANQYSTSISGAWVMEGEKGSQTLFKVFYHRFNTRTMAEAERDRLLGKGIESFVRTL